MNKFRINPLNLAQSIAHRLVGFDQQNSDADSWFKYLKVSPELGM